MSSAFGSYPICIAILQELRNEHEKRHEYSGAEDGALDVLDEAISRINTRYQEERAAFESWWEAERGLNAPVSKE